MTTLHSDPLVADYLHRLDGAAGGLPAQQRAELVAEIRAHIDEALRATHSTGSTGEAAVRNVLKRLGRPEEIMDAAVERTDPPERRQVGGREVVALLALLIPFMGWLIGSVLVLLSPAWTTRERRIGLALPLVVLLFSVVVSLGAPASTALGPLETSLIFALGFAGGPTAAIYLAWRLRSASR